MNLVVTQKTKAKKMCGGDGMSYATVRCDKTQMNRQKPGLSQTYGVHSDKVSIT